MALWTIFLFLLAIFLSFVIGSVSIDGKDAVSVSNETKKPDRIERMFSSIPVLAQRRPMRRQLHRL